MPKLRTWGAIALIIGVGLVWVWGSLQTRETVEPAEALPRRGHGSAAPGGNSEHMSELESGMPLVQPRHLPGYLISDGELPCGELTVHLEWGYEMMYSDVDSTGGFEVTETLPDPEMIRASLVIQGPSGSQSVDCEIEGPVDDRINLRMPALEEYVFRLVPHADRLRIDAADVPGGGLLVLGVLVPDEEGLFTAYLQPSRRVLIRTHPDGKLLWGGVPLGGGVVKVIGE